MRLVVSLDGRSSIPLHALIERLNQDGIRVAGGAMTGDAEAIILFDEPGYTDLAITWLTRVGIRAQRG
jgi:hypothetical protein